MKKDKSYNQLRQISTAVLLEESSHLRLILRSVIAIAVLVISLVVWSSLISITETASTYGELVPEGKVQVIQHLEGGIVKKVYVNEGQEVTRGQMLIEFDPTEKQADLAQMQAREIGLILNIERLRAYIDKKPADLVEWSQSVLSSKYNTVKRNAEIAQLLNDEKNHLAAQNKQRDDQISVLKSTINQKMEKLKEVTYQLEVWKRHVDLLSQEFEMYQKLTAKNLVARKDYLTVLRELNRAKGESVRLASEITQSKEAIVEANNKIKELNSKLTEEALSQLSEYENQLNEVRHKIEKTESELQRMNITSPIKGIVKGLRVFAGNVVKPGGELLQVVPLNVPLMVESRVNTRDIGHIRVGDAVDVKILSYDYARYGSLKGTLIRLSATTFTDEEKKPYYKATIKLEQQYITRFGKKQPLIAGMTVQADVITGKKTLLAYLLKPIQTSTASAFRER